MKKEQTKLIVVIGAGSIGQAIARRVGTGSHILLADLKQDAGTTGIRTRLTRY